MCCPAVGNQTPAQPGPVGVRDPYAQDNLLAWCIVLFYGKHRSPAERAAMLDELGFTRFAYDWRGEHLPTFATELDELKRRGIELTAVWFPGLDDDGKKILALLAERGLHPQLWVTGGGGPTASDAEQQARIEAEANRIRPIAEAAAKFGCQVGLYNHGGWFGEPENQLAVLDRLKMDNVGLVYNLHHAHDQLDRLPELLRKMLPHLLAVNLNGMVQNGEATGQKILPLGQGPLDLEVLRTIRTSGYRGPIGILGHTQDDARERLQDNLDGLRWLLAQLDGQPAGPKPVPRTMPADKASAGGSKRSQRHLIDGRADYRAPPLTVEVRATLRSQSAYNILVASDTKQSCADWEIFSMAGSGMLTAYLPGAEPDHVHTTTNICDGRPHHVVMLYEPQRFRLYADGKLAGEQAIRVRAPRPYRAAWPSASSSRADWVAMDESSSFVCWLIAAEPPPELAADALPPTSEPAPGYWRFADGTEREDLSTFKNPARRAKAGPAAPGQPPPGVHLQPAPRQQTPVPQRD